MSSIFFCVSSCCFRLFSQCFLSSGKMIFHRQFSRAPSVWRNTHRQHRPHTKYVHGYYLTWFIRCAHSNADSSVDYQIAPWQALEINERWQANSNEYFLFSFFLLCEMWMMKEMHILRMKKKMWITKYRGWRHSSVAYAVISQPPTIFFPLAENGYHLIIYSLKSNKLIGNSSAAVINVYDHRIHFSLDVGRIANTTPHDCLFGSTNQFIIHSNICCWLSNHLITLSGPF